MRATQRIRIGHWRGPPAFAPVILLADVVTDCLWTLYLMPLCHLTLRTANLNMRIEFAAGNATVKLVPRMDGGLVTGAQICCGRSTSQYSSWHSFANVDQLSKAWLSYCSTNKVGLAGAVNMKFW